MKLTVAIILCIYIYYNKKYNLGKPLWKDKITLSSYTTTTATKWWKK